MAPSASVTAELKMIRAKIRAIDPSASQAATLTRLPPEGRPAGSSLTEGGGSATGNSPGRNSLSTSSLSAVDTVMSCLSLARSGDQRLQDLVEIYVRQRLVERGAELRRREFPDVEHEAVPAFAVGDLPRDLARPHFDHVGSSVGNAAHELQRLSLPQPRLLRGRSHRRDRQQAGLAGIGT